MAMLKRKPLRDRFDFSEVDERSTSIPQIVLELMVRTRRLYRTWWIAHYTVGLLGVVSGTLLAALASANFQNTNGEVISFLNDISGYSWLIGILAAVCTSMVTFLGPLQKAERYYAAYHHLEQACLEYRGYDDDPRTKKFMKKIMEARGILQLVDDDMNLKGVRSQNLIGDIVDSNSGG